MPCLHDTDCSVCPSPQLLLKPQPAGGRAADWDLKCWALCTCYRSRQSAAPGHAPAAPAAACRQAGSRVSHAVFRRCKVPLCVPCVMHIIALLRYGCQSVLLHHTGMQAARAKRRHKGGQLQKGPVNVPPGATELGFQGSSTRCSYIEGAIKRHQAHRQCPSCCWRPACSWCTF